MILKKDRHLKIFGKDAFLLSMGNMILIKDRHFKSSSICSLRSLRNMILIKDRHQCVLKHNCQRRQLGKYDTYKGSTRCQVYDVSFHSFSPGNMILIKDRHLITI